MIKLDMIVRSMRSRYPPEQLESIPQWRSLASLHASLRKLLPREYLAQFGEDEDEDAGAAAFYDGAGEDGMEDMLGEKRKRVQ